MLTIMVAPHPVVLTTKPPAILEDDRLCKKATRFTGLLKSLIAQSGGRRVDRIRGIDLFDVGRRRLVG